MRKRIVIHLLMIVILTIGLSACLSFTKTRTLEEIKSDLNCIVYKEGMKWKVIEEEFGEPDYAPIPTGEKLSENTRIYEDKTIIFCTELKKIKVKGKIRYEEVITGLEICEGR